MRNHPLTESNRSPALNFRWGALKRWLIDSELEIFMTICIVVFTLLIFVLSDPASPLFN